MSMSCTLVMSRSMCVPSFNSTTSRAVRESSDLTGVVVSVFVSMLVEDDAGEAAAFDAAFGIGAFDVAFVVDSFDGVGLGVAFVEGFVVTEFDATGDSIAGDEGAFAFLVFDFLTSSFFGLTGAFEFDETGCDGVTVLAVSVVFALAAFTFESRALLAFASFALVLTVVSTFAVVFDLAFETEVGVFVVADSVARESLVVATTGAVFGVAVTGGLMRAPVDVTRSVPLEVEAVMTGGAFLAYFATSASSAGANAPENLT